MDELTDIFGGTEQVNNVPENNMNQDSVMYDSYNVVHQEQAFSNQNYQEQYNQSVVQQNNVPEQNTVQQQSQQQFNVDTPNVISVQDLVSQEQTIPKTVIKKKKDKILITQIVLLVLWVALTVLVYYFGYDFFEPFIEV